LTGEKTVRKVACTVRFGAIGILLVQLE